MYFVLIFLIRENIYFTNLPSNPLYADEQIMAQNAKIEWVEHSGRHFIANIWNVFLMENILYSNFSIFHSNSSK